MSASHAKNVSIWSNRAFALVLVLLVPLGLWWTVLIARLVNENHDLRVAMEGDSQTVREDHDRRRRMLWGESGMMALLSVSVVGLSYATAARERQQLRRIEEILAASTHELKTPLAGVRALLESLSSGVLPPEKMAPHLERGLEGCERLEHLVDTVLTWQAVAANPEQPGLKVETRPLREWLGFLPQGAAVEAGPLDQTPVQASPDAIRVILENLIDNARKYGGTTIQVRAERHSDGVYVRVQDDGIGFESGDAERLFEPYQRLNTQTRGTGLGLYISRSLARAMGGDLTATSAGPERGSTFTLLLRLSG